jgi:hypothetical protein
MAILITETGSPLIQSPNTLIALRFWEIAIGSTLGILGGWILHKEKIRYLTIKGLKRISSEFRK